MLEPTDLLQQMSKYSTKQPLKGRHANPREGLPNEGLYGEAQPRGPTPYPYYIPFVTDEVPLSYTSLMTKSNLFIDLV